MTTQINQLTELTTTSDDDLILIREDSTGVDKRMKAQNLRAKATTKDDVGLGNVDNVSAADLRDRSTHTGTQTLATISDAGTIASQNANNVAITGGTINNTPIGGTTASTGNFSNLSYTGTLTGGTGVVNLGSGQVVKDATGNVGIGTSSPTDKLQVNGDTRIAGGNTTHLVVRGAAAGRGVLRLTSDSTSRVRIQGLQSDESTPLALSLQEAGGNVGIGTTAFATGSRMAVQTTSGKFDVKAFGSASVQISSNGAMGYNADTGSQHIWLLGDSEVARITGTGNVGIGTTAPSQRLHVIGNAIISGSLSKGSGSFKIDHPIKPNTHHLVHSFIEGPQADLIYRGKVSLVNGQATVNIDEAGRMTEGTFESLNCNVQCFTNNESGWTCVRGSVSGNILTIEAQDETCTDEISWMVIGERCDQHMIDTDWTDENGRVITEPEKEQQDAD